MTYSTLKRISSGIEGLDDILNGGFLDHRGYLIRGGPGAGKTTLGMHFLNHGVSKNEKVLFITLGEGENELKQNAKSMGFDTSKIDFLDLSPSSDFFAGSKSYDLFTPNEVEKDPITEKIVQKVKELKPRRIFLDSTSHLRYLAIDAYQFRKQLISFIKFLLEEGAIVLFTSEGSPSTPDDDVMYLSDGVITLESRPGERRLCVSKFRGSTYRTGTHTLKLTEKGASVFPKLVPKEHGRNLTSKKVPSGIPEIDKLMHGGIERGTCTVVTGPAGVGKSTLSLQFAKEAASKDQYAVIFSFEESVESISARAENIGIPLNSLLDNKRLKIINIEPLLYTSDEISHMVRKEVENNEASLIIFDGISGYKLSIIGEVNDHLRAIFKYVKNMDVTLIAINETENVTGHFKATEIGISYMADNIVFLRYLEFNGELLKAIGILKKRLGDFERQLREYAITSEGIKVGKPLTSLRGILLGVPSVQEGHCHEELF